MRFRVAVLGGLLALGTACVNRPAAAPSDPSVAAEAALLPARVRRLTNLELERTVSALVGAPVELAARLPPDARQEGFSPNADQGVPSQWATRLHTLAREIAENTANNRLAQLVPCAAAAAPTDSACASELVALVGRRAFRRPLHASEKTALLAAFDTAARSEASFARGAELVLRVLIESPNLLYVSELGTGAGPDRTVTLTSYEIASLLSYTLRGGPPDDQLLARAEDGSLLEPNGREREARRLIGLSDTRHHFRRFVLEWLEVDDLERTAKSASLHPDYDELKPLMLDETRAFVDEVMVSERASVGALLTAGFASVNPTLARYYGLKTWGPRASLAGSGRVGILQQASFLAAHAHEDGTSPVKRGDFVMRKLLCNEVKRPAELGIEVVIPGPSTALTTRERFFQHVSDASCRGCHATIDALGFPFETFDAAGRTRKMENGRRVDPVTETLIGGTRVRFGDSVALSRFLADREDVNRCFARQAFRYFSAQHARGVEQSWLELREELPDERSGNLVEEIVHYAKSDFFVRREVRP